MKNLFTAWMLCLWLCSCQPPPDVQQVAHGRFSAVQVYHRDGNSGPPVLLISDTAADATDENSLLAAVLALNTDVYVLDPATLRQDFASELSQCANLSGDFENLARYLEAWLQVPGYQPPILANSGSTTLVDQLLAPLPSAVFLGQLVFGPVTASPRTATPPCPQQIASAEVAPRLEIPLVQHTPQARQLSLAYQQLMQRLPAAQRLTDGLATLPLTELPSTQQSDTFAILLSGDGGWAGFDKTLATTLQSKGISVVGWDSLRYFWHPTSAEILAADIDRVIAHYQRQWHAHRVMLIGFSQGANVLPFLLDKLSSASRQALTNIALISPEQYARFEFHLSSWVKNANADGGLPLQPVLAEYSGVKLYCLYGSQDQATVCPLLRGTQVDVRDFDAGHHLYDAIDDIVAILLAPEQSAH